MTNDDLEDKIAGNDFDDCSKKELNFREGTVYDLHAYSKNAMDISEEDQDLMYEGSDVKRPVGCILGRGGVPANSKSGTAKNPINKLGDYIAFAPGNRIFIDGENGYALDIDYTQQANQDYSNSFKEILQKEIANKSNIANLVQYNKYWKELKNVKVTPNKALIITEEHKVGDEYIVPIYEK